MKLVDGFLYKILIIILIPIINGGCTAGGFILQKKDLAAVNERLAVLEHDLELQSRRVDKLLDKYQKQQQLLTDNMETNCRSFQLLEDLIKQKNDETNRKLEGLYQYKERKRQSKSLSKTVSTEKLLVGRIEKVRLTPPGRLFYARIDTGATTSSLDARDTETFERDGDDWVRFKIKDPKTDELYEVEKPVIRHVKIIQASTNEADRRPVIELQLKIGRIKIIEEFNLENRAHLNYQVLIGRNVLQDLMLVDVAQKFITSLPEENNNRNATK